MTETALATLIAKDEIRDLVLLYSRGIDRKDVALVRSLYAQGATDDHGPFHSGSAEDYAAKIEQALPHLRYSGHHVCNHLISVAGDEGEGEVYALAWHLIPDGQGGLIEDLELCRYIDRYVRKDGRWKFAARTVEFDVRFQRPAETPAEPARAPLEDPSVTLLTHRLFARGARG